MVVVVGNYGTGGSGEFRAFGCGFGLDWVGLGGSGEEKKKGKGGNIHGSFHHYFCTIN